MPNTAIPPKDVVEQEVPPVEEDQGNPTEEQLNVEEPAKPVLERDLTMKRLAAQQKLDRPGVEGEPEVQNSEELGEPEVETPPGGEAPEVEMVDLKVNGQIIQKSKEEVDAAGGVAAIQKSLSGDMKLEKAAEDQKVIEREREELRQEREQLRQEMSELRALTTEQRNKGITEEPESQEAVKEKAKAIAEKFFLGDADELQDAIESLLNTATATPAAAPQINVEAIAKKAAEITEFQREQKEAVGWFTGKHSDLNEVEGRRNYVNEQTKDLIRKHPTWGPKEVIAAAVKQTREDLDIPAPSDAGKPNDELTRRKLKKRETVDAVPAANERLQTPPAKKPKTPKQIFEEMNASRSHGPG